MRFAEAPYPLLHWLTNKDVVYHLLVYEPSEENILFNRQSYRDASENLSMVLPDLRDHAQHDVVSRMASDLENLARSHLYKMTFMWMPFDMAARLINGETCQLLYPSDIVQVFRAVHASQHERYCPLGP
jgi:hypothetical protein